MKIKELIDYGIKQLNKNNIENSNIKVKSLLQHVLKQNNNYVIVHWDEKVKIEAEIEYKKGIGELIQGKPLQYITHHQEFMNMDFYVNENVLIPQPDTEILVEEVLSFIEKKQRTVLNEIESNNETNNVEENSNIKILDLCTGSGAIAISIAKHLQNDLILNNAQENNESINYEKQKIQFDIFASDISLKALEIAKKNAEANNVEIHFILSDMFENIKEKFDIIVSNPPYIASKEIKDLAKDVQNEPHLALDGGQDGLNFYRVIAKNAESFLKENGTIFLEIGYKQKQSVIELFQEKDRYKSITCIKDLAGNNRVIKINLLKSIN